MLSFQKIKTIKNQIKARAQTARRARARAPGYTALGGAALQRTAEPSIQAHRRLSDRLTPVSCRYLLPPTRLMTANLHDNPASNPKRAHINPTVRSADTVPRPDRPTPDMRATPPLSITNESVSHWVDPRQQMLSGLRWHPVSHMRRPQLSYPASVLSRSSSSGPAIDMSRKISSVTSAAVTFS